MNFADPKSDIAFKKVFGNENKTEILISFLNAVLDLHDEHAIAEITILNPYQAPKISILKETNLDIRAKTNGGVTFIVEMQVEKQDYFAKRALYYTANSTIETNFGLQNFHGRQDPRGAPTRFVGAPVGDPSKDFNPPFRGPDNFQNVFHYNAATALWESWNMGGCMACHGIGQRGGTDFSFILDGGPVPKPELSDNP